MDKVISKSKIDSAIFLTKQYRETGNVSFLTPLHICGMDLSAEAFGHRNNWLAFTDFLSGIVGTCGLAIDTTDNTIYDMLKTLGFTIEL